MFIYFIFCSSFKFYIAILHPIMFRNWIWFSKACQLVSEWRSTLRYNKHCAFTQDTESLIVWSCMKCASLLFALLQHHMFTSVDWAQRPLLSECLSLSLSAQSNITSISICQHSCTIFMEMLFYGFERLNFH